jgi:CheY-like chemotaxis protein
MQTIQLPRKSCDACSAGVVVHSKRRHYPKPMARFLVVDDDPSTVSGLASLLEGDGHQVVPFTSGAAAVGALARESFDVVVTDLEMPHTDGHAVVRGTREHLPHACLVVCSARVEELRSTWHRGARASSRTSKLDYEGVTKAIAQCRSRGGPSVHGGCHMRAPTGSTATPLARDARPPTLAR